MTETPDARTGDAAARLSQDTVDLVRAEIERARQELLAALRRGGVAAALLGGGAISGVLALGTGTAAILRLMQKVMSPAEAAIALTGFYTGAAAALGALGAQQAKAATRPATEAVDAVREDVRRATDAAR